MKRILDNVLIYILSTKRYLDKNIVPYCTRNLQQENVKIGLKKSSDYRGAILLKLYLINTGLE